MIRFEIPEDGLPADHAARVLWEVLGSLDLSAFLAKAKAVEGHVGRKKLYRARASSCELPNAHFRSRYGMQQFRVRGLTRATSVALLTAVTHNLLGHASKLLA